MFKFTRIILLHLTLILVFCSVFIVDSASPSTEKLPPCAACKALTDSFKKGIVKTSQGTFEGGPRGKARLTEIQENLCKDLPRGQDQCHTLAKEWETTIDDWWFKDQDKNPDVYNYICIKQKKQC